MNPPPSPDAADTPPPSPAASPVESHYAVTLRASRFLAVLHHLAALLYPLALLAAGVFLFATFGATGWLWLVILLVIVLAIVAPKSPNV